jgi:hypothetical protein
VLLLRLQLQQTKNWRQQYQLQRQRPVRRLLLQRRQ